MAEVQQAQPDNTTTTNTNTNNVVEEKAKKPDLELLKCTGVSPSPRNGQTLTVINDTLYMFGGNDAKDHFNQLHMFVPESNVWIPLPGAPSPRTLHSAVEHYNTIVVFGGTGLQESRGFLKGVVYTQQLLNDVWQFNPLRMEWKKVETQGTVISPRDGHSAVVVDGLMYVFGGSNDLYVFNDLFSLHLAGSMWKSVTGGGSVPAPRRLHSCVVYERSLWIFGGYDGKGSFNDIYKFDVDSKIWSLVNSSGDIPGARFGHTAVVHNSKMYVFGGYGAGVGCKKDLYQFTFETGEWKVLSSNCEMSAVKTHSAVVYKDKMYLFGGSKSSYYSNEMWTYSFETVHTKPPNPFVENILSIFDDKEMYSDITFKVGDTTINAHKNILASRSVYFKTLFQSGMKESFDSIVTIEDVSPEAFVAVMKYLYSGDENFVTPQTSFELLSLAEKYFLPHLKWVCAKVLEDHVSVENVATLLQESELHECEKLFQACMTFISNNHQEVIKTEGFKTLPQHLLLKTMTVISARK